MFSSSRCFHDKNTFCNLISTVSVKERWDCVNFCHTSAVTYKEIKQQSVSLIKITGYLKNHKIHWHRNQNYPCQYLTVLPMKMIKHDPAPPPLPLSHWCPTAPTLHSVNWALLNYVEKFSTRWWSCEPNLTAIAQKLTGSSLLHIPWTFTEPNQPTAGQKWGWLNNKQKQLQIIT